jgi:acyl-coenzyme A thioesterase PaaI-like protein
MKFNIPPQIEEQLTTLSNAIPTSVKETVLLRGFTLWKIPLIAFLSPRVDRLDDERVEITIPLGYRSRNHIGSMYFGALATGADLAMGYMVFREMQKSKLRATFVFKSFEAEFLKRGEADVVFTCTQGAELKKLVADCAQTDERLNREFEVTATTPSLTGEEPIAKFKLTLSVKRR